MGVSLALTPCDRQSESSLQRWPALWLLVQVEGHRRGSSPGLVLSTKRSGSWNGSLLLRICGGSDVHCVLMNMCQGPALSCKDMSMFVPFPFLGSCVCGQSALLASFRQLAATCRQMHQSCQQVMGAWLLRQPAVPTSCPCWSLTRKARPWLYMLSRASTGCLLGAWCAVHYWL